MNTNSKRGVISPYQLFFIILASRAVVALTFYQSVLKNGVSPDSLLSSLLALGINLLLCLPAVLCCKKEKSPLKTGAGRIIYFVYYFFFAGINAARFALFANERTVNGAGIMLFIFLMCAAACYAAFLGIEAIGRFSVICAVLSVFLLLIIMLLNIKSFHPSDFLPFFVGSRADIAQNSLIFSSGSIEPALYFILFEKCEKSRAKGLLWGIVASYGAIFLMLLFCVGVLGSAAPLFDYPVFTLFQMTAFGSFSRLDILYTAFGFFALFAKCAVLVYCAAACIKRTSPKAKEAFIFVPLAVLSFFLCRLLSSQSADFSRKLYIYLTLVFCVLIPLLFLLIPKKGRKKNESN